MSLVWPISIALPDTIGSSGWENHCAWILGFWGMRSHDNTVKEQCWYEGPVSIENASLYCYRGWPETFRPMSIVSNLKDQEGDFINQWKRLSLHNLWTTLCNCSYVTVSRGRIQYHRQHKTNTLSRCQYDAMSVNGTVTKEILPRVSWWRYFSTDIILFRSFGYTPHKFTNSSNCSRTGQITLLRTTSGPKFYR